MRGSGSAGSTPVATPAGAPPVPPAVPDTEPTLTVGGATGGSADGVSVGARSGAGLTARFGGSLLALDPLPTASRGAGRVWTYWMRSVASAGGRGPKSAEIGYRKVIDAIIAITTM